MSTDIKREIRYYETSEGGKVYQIPIYVFTGLWGYVYLILVENSRILIDSGSGYGDSNQQLEDGLATVSGMSGEDVSLHNLTHILITHGHIDHFGGLTYIRERTEAKIGIHELDRRIVTNHEERLSVVARRLSEFLVEAGVSPEEQTSIIELYKLTKSLFRSVVVDFSYEAVGMRVGPLRILHVPGHCAGHVVIRLHDILFSGDHILEQTSPHQAPEQLTLSTGLEHYLKSLEVVRPWAREVRLTLGGHENPITDLQARLDEIKSVHHQRLKRVIDLLIKPHTIAEISKELFGEVFGYNILLAIEETGAHVEYLYQRGLLSIENLEEMEKSNNLVPIRYKCIDCKMDQNPGF